MKPTTKILYLAPCWPTEQSYGTQLRTSLVASALQAIGQVDFIVVNFADESTPQFDGDSSFHLRRVIKLRPVAIRSRLALLRRGLDAKFINYHGQSVEEQDRLFVLSELPNYDLVWLHNLRTANVFGQWAWPRSVMDIDDIPSTFHRTVLKNGSGVWQRFRAGGRMLVARRRERLLGQRFTVLSVCSDADRKYLRFNDRVHVIPNGFARPVAEPIRKLATPPRIGFIGLFDYVPNSDGVQWFVRECWPRIKQEVPDCRLRLVGKGTDGLLKPLGPDIDSFGWIPDPTEEIATWSTMIVPVRFAGGTRVKIAEAFSRKCPVVSTRLGAFGYGVQDGEELLLADKPAAFANACLKTIRCPTDAAAMTERAWQQFLQKWTWDSIRPSVLAAAEDCLRQSKLPPD